MFFLLIIPIILDMKKDKEKKKFLYYNKVFHIIESYLFYSLKYFKLLI